MRCKPFVMLALLSVVALRAGAAELIPSWQTDAIWNSNVFNSPDEKESDFSFRAGPTVRVREPRGDLTYDLSLRVQYDDYLRINGISDFDYFANARGAWNATSNTRFELSEDFVSTSTLNLVTDSAGVVGADPIVRANLQRTTSNALLGAVTHRLGPLWQLRIEATNSFYEYEDPDDNPRNPLLPENDPTNLESQSESNSTSTRGLVQLTRTISRRLKVGAGTQFTRQEFDTDGTSIYQGFASLDYSISPTWSLSLQAGPGYVVPDQIDTQPGPVFGSFAAPLYVAGAIDSCQTDALGIPVVRRIDGRVTSGCPQAIVLQDPSGRLFRVQPAPVGTFRTIPILVFSEVRTVESTLNYFGRLTLSKEWRRWSASLSYTRSISASSGLGQSTLLDSLTGDLTWTPSRRWGITLSSQYSKQEALTESAFVIGSVTGLRAETLNVPVVQINPDGSPVIGPNGQPVTTTAAASVPVPFGAVALLGDSTIDVATVRVDLRAYRRVTKNLNVTGFASYWNQQRVRANQTFESTQRDVFRVGFGFTWTFDPIPL